MKFASLLATASLALGALCNSLDAPTFTKVFNGTLVLDESRGQIDTHSGKLFLVEFTGGNLTDPHTGKLIATFEHIGGQFGLTFNNQFVHTDVHFVTKWADDGTYAHWQLWGCGTIADGLHSYARVDTGSKSRLDWQDNFFMFHINPFGDNPVKQVGFYKMDINWTGKTNATDCPSHR
ncbi:hypothetical protein E1B28_008296 [Marasmius oreades]|uniref:Uncharacterized protein n=1 Tax=Marasmius oreades TaxID=181124 RepID=A0A9P7US89_9AGAR|nr:uncharacterized protein E1B28_008296 [Marasmius oreades]KAG7091895.1 hypothetical protein E1B28_008296 [Marasmius oreades]